MAPANAVVKIKRLGVAMEVIATGLAFPEGPVVMDDGSVILVEIQRGTLTRVSPSGDVDVIADLGGGPNGAALGPDGHCYVCNNGGFKWYTARDGRVFPGDQPDDYVSGSIQRVNLSTGAFDTIYDQCEGEPLKGPNDLVFDRAWRLLVYRPRQGASQGPRSHRGFLRQARRQHDQGGDFPVGRSEWHRAFSR